MRRRATYAHFSLAATGLAGHTGVGEPCQARRPETLWRVTARGERDFEHSNHRIGGVSRGKRPWFVMRRMARGTAGADTRPSRTPGVVVMHPPAASRPALSS